MDLNYCSVCYQPTDGNSLYCSDACYLHDSPEETKNQFIAPLPISPTNIKGFKYVDHHFHSRNPFDGLDEGFEDLLMDVSSKDKSFYPTRSPVDIPERPKKISKTQHTPDWVFPLQPTGIDHRPKKPIQFSL